MDEPSDGLFTTPEMAAAFSPEAHVRGMLAFEAALARAQARAGVSAALSPDDIDRALDPAGYLGSADVFIDRALDSYRTLQVEQGAGWTA